MIVEGRVGSKGELFPPKSIREKLGLKPHMRVIYRVKDGVLIVEPIPTLEDVMRKHPEVVISLEDFHRFRKSSLRRLNHEVTTRYYLLLTSNRYIRKGTSVGWCPQAN